MINFYQSNITPKVFFFSSIVILMILFNIEFGLSQGAGNTLNFNGSDNYVSLTQNSGLPIYNNSDYTIEFWVIGSPQSNRAVFSEANNGSTTENWYTLFNIGSELTGTNNHLDIYIREGDGTLPFGGHRYSSTIVFDGAWHHVAWVDANGTATLYIDGNVDATDFTYQKPSLSLNTSSIGAIASNPTYPGIRSFFGGLIDEVRIWNDIRTQTEIRDNMCRKLIGSEANLVAYYPFDDPSGTTLTDLTSNSNNGTVYGTQGIATSGGTNTLTNTGAAWITNEWSGETVYITDGTGSGQSGIVASNTPTVLAVTTDWTTIPDNTSTYSITNSDAWQTSAAPIGDVSAYNYSSPFDVNLSHPDGDNLAISAVTGSPTSVHIYYVDEAPNITTPPATWNNIDPLRYWGVWVPGGTGPTYTVQYNWDGHPGIFNESALELATRTSGHATTWTDAGATRDVLNNTLTISGQGGRVPQYILGSILGDNPLPVELASFIANLISDGIQLQWTTFSEINNDGFEIWRSIDNDQNFQLLSSYQNNPELAGAGNSSSTHQYGYLDREIQDGHTYYYQLWDVSFGGERVSHPPVSVSTTQPSGTAENYVLFQNYPNPFNPITHIRFQINDISLDHGTSIPVNLNIYDLLGRKVKTLINQDLNIGDYTLTWDGTNDFQQNVASGSYIYLLQIGDQKFTRQLILVR